MQAQPHHTTEASRALDRTAWIGLLLGPVLFLMTWWVPPPEGLSPMAWHVLGMALLMAIWWSTEALPIPVTALLPILIIPALGAGSLRDASAPYADPVIFLFLGGFMLGLAMQRWNLHRRIALLTLLAVGTRPSRQIAGFMIATAFLSMWVSNTATTIMMLPIGLSVIALMQSDNAQELERFATAMLLSIAYAASIGGVATLIGTPPNALLAAYLKNNHDIAIGFGQWMLIGLPVAVSMLVFTGWWLTRGGFRLGEGGASRTALQDALRELGPLSRGERTVGLIFVLTALAWIFRPLFADRLPWLDDTSIAMAATLALFVTPVDAGKRIFVMDWSKTEGVPWGVLLLFGGGLSLAGVIRSSGLAEWIANSLGAFGALPLILMMALVVAVIIFLTEVTSNTATAAAFLPLLGALAVAQDVSPLLFAVPAAIAASCAFMMPVATPPNAIVFATGHMRIQAMIRAGFVLNLGGVVLVTLLSYGLISWIWLG